MEIYYVDVKIEMKKTFNLLGEDPEKIKSEFKQEMEKIIKDAIDNNIELKQLFFESKPKVKIKVANQDNYKGNKEKTYWWIITKEEEEYAKRRRKI